MSIPWKGIGEVTGLAFVLFAAPYGYFKYRDPILNAQGSIYDKLFSISKTDYV